MCSHIWKQLAKTWDKIIQSSCHSVINNNNIYRERKCVVSNETGTGTGTGTNCMRLCSEFPTQSWWEETYMALIQNQRTVELDRHGACWLMLRAHGPVFSKCLATTYLFSIDLISCQDQLSNLNPSFSLPSNFLSLLKNYVKLYPVDAREIFAFICNWSFSTHPKQVCITIKQREEIRECLITCLA